MHEGLSCSCKDCAVAVQCGPPRQVLLDFPLTNYASPINLSRPLPVSWLLFFVFCIFYLPLPILLQ